MPVITTADLREHLNLPADQDETLLLAKIEAAEKHLEAFTGRAFLTQTRTVHFDQFCRRLALPIGPVQSVTSVKYLDPDQVEQTLAPDQYMAHPLASDDPTYIVPTSGVSWPSTTDLGAAVSVEYVSGYGDAADVPEAIKEAIRQLAAHWYENREAALVGVNAQVLPLGLFDLVQSFRRMVF